MASLNISMPDELRDFVEKRTKENHFATPTEYIRSLVREDQKKAEADKLERLLLDGLGSGKSINANDLDAYFEQKKRQLLQRVPPRPRRK